MPKSSKLKVHTPDAVWVKNCIETTVAKKLYNSKNLKEMLELKIPFTTQKDRKAFYRYVSQDCEVGWDWSEWSYEAINKAIAEAYEDYIYFLNE